VRLRVWEGARSEATSKRFFLKRGGTLFLCEERSDEKKVVRCYTVVVYDRRFAPAILRSSSNLTSCRSSPLSSFFGTTITVRRADGALLTSTVPPYPAMLYEYVDAGRFKEAVRLCRFIKNKQLWATLAAMSISHQDLDSAEIALSATKEVDKLQYIKYIKGIESSEVRNAEMMLYKRCPEEAER